MRARLRATLRLSWRLARRSPARSLLVALLVAVPVCAGVFVTTMTSTAQLSPAQAATRYLGQADAIAIVEPDRSLDGGFAAVGMGPKLSGDQVQRLTATPQTRDPASVNLTELLPKGARAIPVGWQRGASVTAGDRTTQAPAVLVDLRDPLTRGLYEIRSGTAPRTSSDIAVTAALADRLQVGAGASLTADGQAFRVTAVLRKPAGLKVRELVGPQASVGRLGDFPGRGAVFGLTWLIGFPNHMAADLHDDLAHHGVIYATRTQWEHPPPSLQRTAPTDQTDLITRASIAGFGLLEILLLAGTALAVGARRQVEQLGILRAVGAEQGHIRRILLGQGLILGFGGAVLGAGAGVVAAVLARPVVESFTARALGPLDVPVPALVVAVLAGGVAGIVAAALPARAVGRLSVLDMLRQQFRASGSTVRAPWWAFAGLLLGTGLVVSGAAGLHHGPRYLEATVTSADGAVHNYYSSPNHDAWWTVMLSIGAALFLAGLAGVCPAMLAYVERTAGRRLPLTFRLAARDANRHRHRTTPAILAMATLVAGAVLVLFVASSDDARNQRAYVPKLPVGTVSVTANGGIAELIDLTGSVARSLHTSDAGAAMYVTGQPPAYLNVQMPGCPWREESPSARCGGAAIEAVGSGWLDAVLGRHVAPASAMLARGGAVVLRPSLVENGKIALATHTLSDGNSGTPIVSHAGHLPALAMSALPATQFVPAVLISPETASAHGWATQPSSGIVRPTQLPSPAEMTEVTHELGDRVQLYAERGYQPRHGLVVSALVAGAALVLLIGTLTTTALTMSESRRDMSIVAAVGAPPSRRRLQAMSQAALVSALGGASGIVLGGLVGLALQIGSLDYPVSVPWRWLLPTALIGVLLAMVLAGAVTRSRVAMPRRQG